jgi:hypothetical protein
MSAHLINNVTREHHVTLSVVKGGEFVGDAEHDAAIMQAWDGRYENVHMRVFGLDGKPVEFRFSADDMRKALELVADLGRRGVFA